MIRLADASDSSALTALIERYWEFERIKGFDAARITTLLNELFRSPDRGQIWVAQEGTDIPVRVAAKIAATLILTVASLPLCVAIFTQLLEKHRRKQRITTRAGQGVASLPF